MSPVATSRPPSRSPTMRFGRTRPTSRFHADAPVLRSRAPAGTSETGLAAIQIDIGEETLTALPFRHVTRTSANLHGAEARRLRVWLTDFVRARGIFTSGGRGGAADPDVSVLVDARFPSSHSARFHLDAFSTWLAEPGFGADWVERWLGRSGRSGRSSGAAVHPAAPEPDTQQDRWLTAVVDACARELAPQIVSHSTRWEHDDPPDEGELPGPLRLVVEFTVQGDAGNAVAVLGKLRRSVRVHVGAAADVIVYDPHCEG
jgi:hypothetical protein